MQEGTGSATVDLWMDRALVGGYWDRRGAGQDSSFGIHDGWGRQMGAALRWRGIRHCALLCLRDANGFALPSRWRS